MKLLFISLGCDKNLVDTEHMLSMITKDGITITNDENEADVIVVNSCCFISDAMEESIQTLIDMGSLKETANLKALIVTGCLAERYAKEIAEQIPEVDAVIGTNAYDEIVSVIHEVMEGHKTSVKKPLNGLPKNYAGRTLTTGGHFAHLKIAEGCDKHCTYCVIPSIRGNYRSVPMEDILAEAASLAADGVKELILVAQETTLYGVDLYGKKTLPTLLKKLSEIEGIRWIRLLYCYPEHITDELLDVMAAEDKVLNYMDIPIQHVSGKVLTAMNRTGDARTLRELIARIRDRVPGIVLRTTVMTGFPGEGEAEVVELCQFIQDVKFERLGCFAFSPEEGTVAASLPGQIEEEEKQRRRDIVMEEQTRISDAYNQAQVGKTIPVLVESYDRYAECWFGRSEGDAPDIDGKVFFSCPRGAVQPGRLVQVNITDAMDWDLMGEYVDESAQ